MLIAEAVAAAGKVLVLDAEAASPAATEKDAGFVAEAAAEVAVAAGAAALAA